MNAANYTPPLRLEIRDKTPDDSAPWYAFDLAQTDAQAADKILRHRVAATCETRVGPNDPLELELEQLVQDTPGTLQLIEQVQTENMALRRDLNTARAELAKFRVEKIAAANPVDALAGETPLPFGVGDVLRDIHTGVAVRVTELNPRSKMGNRRPGFAWINLTTKEGDKDHTGWCPLGSVGCFAKISADAPTIVAPPAREPAPPAARATAAVPVIPVAEVPVNPPAAAHHKAPAVHPNKAAHPSHGHKKK